MTGINYISKTKISEEKDKIMWLDRILQEKERLHISTKTMSERTGGHLPERTISRILSRETESPRIDTIIELGTSVGLSPQELFADTNVVAATETFVEVKETAGVTEAERDLLAAENAILKDKVSALTAELDIVKMQLKHKEEIIALHNYYNKLKT